MHLECYSQIWWDGYQLFDSAFSLMQFSSFYEQGYPILQNDVISQLVSGSRAWPWAKEMLFDFVATSARKHLKHMPFRELAMTVWSLGTVLIANDPFVTFGEFSAVPLTSCRMSGNFMLIPFLMSLEVATQAWTWRTNINKYIYFY